MEVHTPKAGPEHEQANHETDRNGPLKSVLSINPTLNAAKTILDKISTATVVLDSIGKDLPAGNKIILERINNAVAVLDGIKKSLPAIDNDENCYLLDAPAEIRNEIWLLVLNICKAVCLNEVIHCGAFHSKPRRFKVPSLLRINRQIRYETAGLYYSKTTFLCHFSAATFTQSLSVVDIDHLKFIRNIECRSYDGTRSARLFLQVVSEMLGERSNLLREGAVKAALKTKAMGESSDENDGDWISLSEVQAWNEETKKVKGKGELK